MTKQLVYLVVDVYDSADPTPVQLYDNLDAANRHAAHLNKLLGSDEDEPVFAVLDWAVRSEFNL